MNYIFIKYFIYFDIDLNQLTILQQNQLLMKKKILLNLILVLLLHESLQQKWVTYVSKSFTYPPHSYSIKAVSKSLIEVEIELTEPVSFEIQILKSVFSFATSSYSDEVVFKTTKQNESKAVITYHIIDDAGNYQIRLRNLKGKKGQCYQYQLVIRNKDQRNIVKAQKKFAGEIGNYMQQQNIICVTGLPVVTYRYRIVPNSNFEVSMYRPSQISEQPQQIKQQQSYQINAEQRSQTLWFIIDKQNQSLKTSGVFSYLFILQYPVASSHQFPLWLTIFGIVLVFLAIAVIVAYYGLQYLKKAKKLSFDKSNAKHSYNDLISQSPLDMQESQKGIESKEQPVELGDKKIQKIKENQVQGE